MKDMDFRIPDETLNRKGKLKTPQGSDKGPSFRSTSMPWCPPAPRKGLLQLLAGLKNNAPRIIHVCPNCNVIHPLTNDEVAHLQSVVDRTIHPVRNSTNLVANSLPRPISYKIEIRDRPLWVYILNVMLLVLLTDDLGSSIMPFSDTS